MPPYNKQYSDKTSKSDMDKSLAFENSYVEGKSSLVTQNSLSKLYDETKEHTVHSFDVTYIPSSIAMGTVALNPAALGIWSLDEKKGTITSFINSIHHKRRN